MNSPTSKYSHLCAPFRSFKFLISRHKLLPYSVRNRRAVPPALPSLVSHRISRFLFLPLAAVTLDSPSVSGRLLCPRRARVPSIKKEDTVWYLLIRRRRDLNSPTSKYSHLCAPFRSFKFLISRHKLLPYSVRNRRAVPPALPSLVSHRISRFLFLPLAAVTLDSPSVSGRLLCPRRARVPSIKKEDTVWYLLIRRRRDLNPRAAQTTYTLSRGASSAT